MNLNELKWDEKGGYWYDQYGTQITPQEMLEYAVRMTEKYICALRITAKVAKNLSGLSGEVRDDIGRLEKI